MTYSTHQWGTVELAFDGPSEGNPYLDVVVRADFVIGDRTISVPGFYAGEGRYLVRFMPDQVGQWTFMTTSNVAELTSKQGRLTVSDANRAAHGPVRADGKWGFQHADGKRFTPVGTTIYAFAHQPQARIDQTMHALAQAPFNKVRLCVFPKHFIHNDQEPLLYPFPIVEKGREVKGSERYGDYGWRFDHSRFDEAFFQNLERVVVGLGGMGIQAELILFHPYDRWGFSNMSAVEDDLYVRYLVARFAAFPHVWWSMANEFDLMPAKSDHDWDRLLRLMANEDPFDHLRSVHNCFRLYDHAHPAVTHVSVQRGETAQMVVSASKFDKPVIIDECGYEGDLADSWGNLDGREMLHRIWQAMINGGFATHGETFRTADDVVFWSKGGSLRGDSVARIGFLRALFEELSEKGVKPQASIQRMGLEAEGKNIDMDQVQAAALDPGAPESVRSVLPWCFTLGDPRSVYLTYFGVHQPSEVTAAVPYGETYDATLIDSWEMRRTLVASGVQRGTKIEIPAKPYQALLLQRTATSRETSE